MVGMLEAELAPVAYRLDARDRIVWVNDAFGRFADANGAEGLGVRAVGRSLYDFVAGEDVKGLLRAFLSHVRKHRRPSRYPFRCDSPTFKRRMLLDVEPLADGGLSLVASFIQVEAQPEVRLFSRSAARSRAPLLVCAWCRRVHAGEWVEAPEGIRRLRLFEVAMPMVTHGICPPCRESVLAQVERS